MAASPSRLRALAASAAVALVLTSCGGRSEGPGPVPSPPETTTTVATGGAAGAGGPVPGPEDVDISFPPGMSPEGLEEYDHRGQTLEALPEARSDDRLLVSTIGVDHEAVLIDLGEGTVVSLEDVAASPYDYAALTPGGAVVAVGPRTIGFVDATGDLTGPPIELAASEPGTIAGIGVAGDHVLVATEVPRPDDPPGQGDPGPTVLYDLDGNRRCATAPGASWWVVRDPAVGLDGFGGVLDPERCTVSPGPAPVADLEPRWWTGDTLLVEDEGRILRLEPGRSDPVAASPPVGTVDAVAESGDVWAVAGSELLRLDPRTLEVTETVFRFDCADWSRFEEVGDRLYVLAECEGVLYELDTDLGAVAAGWYVPNDGSDILLHPWPVTDGMWMVDVEGPGIPYLFDADQRRFERLPLEPSVLEQLFGLTFEVDHRPPPGADPAPEGGAEPALRA